MSSEGMKRDEVMEPKPRKASPIYQWPLGDGGVHVVFSGLAAARSHLQQVGPQRLHVPELVPDSERILVWHGERERPTKRLGCLQEPLLPVFGSLIHLRWRGFFD